MEWREVIEHPSLQDLPFKIETNKWGAIMMTPASPKHSKQQTRIIEWFLRLGQWGQVRVECPIQTADGVKVADVAWGSKEFFERNDSADLVYEESPEIVVEVRSPSNSLPEMKEKKGLYFEKGAKEVWLCDKEGIMHFFNPQGGLKRSELFGEFPEQIDIDIAH